MSLEAVEVPAPQHPRPRCLAPNQGEAVWFVDHLVVVKQAAQHGGRCAILEISLGAGAATPLHRHEHEDESFYVLEGALELHIEGQPLIEATPGTFVQAPRGIAHGFRVPRYVRMLVVCDPNGFVDFTREAGVPAPRLELPPPAAPDIERLLRCAPKHGIELLGPLPA